MGRTVLQKVVVSFLLALCLLPISTQFAGGVASNDECSAENDGAKTCASDDVRRPMSPCCGLVMAESSIPGAGWGVFSMKSLPRGVPVSFGDVVIQVADIDTEHADGLAVMFRDYVWDSQETGGFYEGMSVVSVLPGMGMLANGYGSSKSNILPYVPQLDEADLIRTSSPGAGAISHYHNHTFFVQRPIEEGGEVFVNYGKNWFQERVENLSNEEPPAPRSVLWLRENGWCLDNIKPGRSTNKEAGRGAIATRFLNKGAVIAPAPVVVIGSRASLHTTRIRNTNVKVQGDQLLLNYCMGHSNSSLLLYPYSPLVNFINHDSQKANAVLRWSKHCHSMEWTQKSLDEVQAANKTDLLLEIVATQDIFPGDEVFLDYGKDWEQAWNKHVETWKPPPDAETYTPAYVMDDVVKLLRTEAEQKLHPYPDNVFTSCFYRYSDHREEAEKANEQNNKKIGETTAFKWEMKRGMFELRNLRPCSVLAREQGEGKTVWFTVKIRNRYGLAPEERIPKGALHIVTRVPRHAIRFSDKIYTTDQHLENVFRHEIGIPDDVFPEQWMDLK